jgi:ATP-dependent RNA helicase DHX33
MIAVTQPRKVAATALAARVATEQNVALGALVGYSVRFDERCNDQTRIKYLTDGMIIRELLSDSVLSRYSVIIVDEAHERTLRTDLLLSNLKTIQQNRNGAMDVKRKGPALNQPNPLKIIIMSATLDAEKFSNFFHKWVLCPFRDTKLIAPRSAKIIYVQGRQHPVKILHTAVGQIDYVDAALRTFFQIHTDQPPGDVLIFLPGSFHILLVSQCITILRSRGYRESGKVDTAICKPAAERGYGGTKH